MGLAKTRSAAISGVTGVIVDVEANIGAGLPGTYIVGLADAAVAEARQRIKTAVNNSELPWPKTKVIVNLSPASLRKNGAQFDLGICMAIMAAAGMHNPDCRDIENTLFLGEIGLDGVIKPISGLVPALLAARGAEIRNVVIPWGNAAEAMAVIDDSAMNVLVARSISEATEWLKGNDDLIAAHDVILDEHATKKQPHKVGDMQDVVGQSDAKKAAEIAVAGGHNIVMIGPPGSGKSMIAQRMAGLLPALTHTEMIEATAIHSVMGQAFNGPMTHPPFVAPHHSITKAALLGGGSGNLQPGAASLAHTGVLFLDEVSEIPANILDCLRMPLECGEIKLMRHRREVTFPARFQLVMATNPCRCAAKLPSECRCSATTRARYLNNISGPLRDRLDIFVRTHAQGAVISDTNQESSKSIAERVQSARERSEHRWRTAGFTVTTNAAMDPYLLRRHFPADEASMALLSSYLGDGELSQRGVDRALKVAWTLCDLEGKTRPDLGHTAYALELRDDCIRENAA
ncbi:YifB family Mg chelatase-like AAA ATPase [Corynebacterium diphtheriae]|uniref:YifB family Mg chelatase-like AAA ATPase n=1 Tax=Corynebacterium diphtheriae TaxID=1717 RepID=UPI0018CB768C|nr:YifB family Mg chelatase-like AAA ATPase [Corynebacterium diphtheriae]MBG9264103.1 YifB family Mg chelatase-like AAA ATPase [Corynebacterium diphtheriae bv. gravis]